MMTQVISEESVAFNFRCNTRYTGLKTPVMTMAKTITEKKGHRSQPSKTHDTRNKARKNHKIMSRGDDGFKLPPRTIG